MATRRHSAWLAAALVLGLALGAAETARAHRLEVFAYWEGGRLRGEGAYDDGGGAEGATVKVIDADGKLLGETRSDDEGGFALVPASGRPPLLVEMRDDMGHRATFALAEAPGAAPPAAAPAAPAAPAAASAPVVVPGGNLGQEELAGLLREELAPLKAQLARLAAAQERAGVREVVGGLGWIAGLFGLAAWWAGRRRGRG